MWSRGHGLEARDPPAFGAAMREEFLLTPGLVFLNHGSYGATPREVLMEEFQYQIDMERNTLDWMTRKRLPLIEETRTQIAAYSNADKECVTMVIDATSAVNAVFRSMKFLPGDRILYLSTVYGAFRELLTIISQVHPGVEIVEVPIVFPLSGPEDVVDAVRAVYKQYGHGAFRIALFSHITSPTAVIFPAKDLTTLAHYYGCQVFIDGAHAFGEITVDVTDIGAEYYTSNIHKWLCGPKGAAMLYVNGSQHWHTKPTSISSAAGDGYLPAFDWTGTVDFSAYFSTMSALAWREKIGGEEAVNGYMKSLSDWAAEAVANVWQTPVAPMAPLEMYAAMAIAQLPDYAQGVWISETQEALFEEYNIEVVLFEVQDTLYTRMSCQVYNFEQEYLDYALALLNVTANALERRNAPQHLRTAAFQHLRDGERIALQISSTLSDAQRGIL